MDLIRTRLHPPTRGAGLIRRVRLDLVARRIRHRRLVFVKAPAGYGKSSLLHGWLDELRQAGTTATWLSLDLAQDDLRSFFQHVLSAIREQLAGFGNDVLAFLETAREPNATRIVAAFLDALMAWDGDIVLFIDDFHLLADRAAIRAIEMLVRDAPRNFHLVIASRKSLPFSIARLQMLGVTEALGPEQLRFDAEELGSFIRLSGRAPLDEAATDSLLAATEGWAAGIQLALISLAQHKDLEPFLSRFSGGHRLVSEFLIDDVIDNLAGETVDFLLKTSILPIFNRDLCKLVAGTDDAGARIEALSAQSLFIFSLDDEKDWFRYHHLFSDVLQRMLHDRMPEQVAALHRSASDWYARNGYAELGFGHAAKAGDWFAAARILDARCVKLFQQGQLSTLMRLAEQIPAEILKGFPRIRLELAWSIILEWRFQDALAIISEVEHTLQAWQSTDVPPETIAEIERVALHRRMMLALFMDDVPALERSVLQLLRDFRSDEPYLRGTLENSLLYARREMFQLDEVERMDSQARDFFSRSGSRFVLVWHQAVVGPTFHLRGDTERAVQALQSAIEIAEAVEGAGTPLQAMPGVLLAEILYERNELDAAARLLERFGQATLRLGFVDNMAAYYVTRIRLCARHGDDAEVRALIAEGNAGAELRGFSRLQRRLWLEQVRLAARTGDIGRLRAELAAADEPAAKRRLAPGPHSLGQDEYLALGWAIAACQTGQARAAADLLRRWVAFAASRAALRSEVRLLVGLAAALSLAGDHGQALRKMRLAVEKAARPRFVASFLDAGEPVHSLLADLFDLSRPAVDPVSAFGAELLHAFAGAGAAHEAAADRVDGAPHLAAPEALTQREREVLRLVSRGSGNKDIARVMGMTEGTVKWHMQQVFAKLDVRRRSQAVQRARQFGLL